MRTVIIGNSGSGKTWLAKQLSAFYSVPVIHLDELFWEPGGFDRKRTRTEVSALIATHRQLEHWIVEGVFGSLAEEFLDSAEFLIWLDMPWEVCSLRLKARGSESKQHMSRAQSEEGMNKLVAWAGHYYDRGGDCSLAGHLALYRSFVGKRFRLTSENSVETFLANDVKTFQVDR